MTNAEKKAKAKSLWLEYKKEYLAFYGRRRVAGYKCRLKNLAGHIDLASTDLNEIGAIMYLDQVALWLDMNLTPGFKNQ